MIGQWVINVSSGGRGRLSCLVTGVVLLLLVVYASKLGIADPDGGAVAVMIMVSIGTFHWKRFAELKTHPRTAIVNMVTHGLAKGVLTGVLLKALYFRRRVSAILGG